MKTFISHTFGTAVIVLLLISSAAGQPGDEGIPDSAYLLPASFQPLNCQGQLRGLVPVYLFSDGTCQWIETAFYWSGNADFDTFYVHGAWSHPTVAGGQIVDRANRKVNIFLFDFDYGFRPGSSVVMELAFKTNLGDTFQVSFPIDSMVFATVLLNGWYPTYQNLHGVYAAPDTFAMPDGDADCSGSTDISDAVVLIAHIFNGGPPPYDMNSGDPNADCAVDISDVVYLIAYIFGNGPGPLHGCVVQ